MEDNFGVSGSSSTFAISILEAEYNPEMTVEEGEALAEKAVRNSLKRDAMTGNGIDIMTITSEGMQEKRILLNDVGEE